jgi:hypothetical protein
LTNREESIGRKLAFEFLRGEVFKNKISIIDKYNLTQKTIEANGTRTRAIISFAQQRGGSGVLHPLLRDYPVLRDWPVQSHRRLRDL